MLANTAHNWRACVGGFAVVLLFVILGPSLMAQTGGRGALRGTATDPTGAPVAFAMVTTTSIDSGQTLPAATGTDGTYKFSLPPGNYRLRFESAGYKTVEIPAVKINGPWTVVQNCQLEADAQTPSSTTAEPAQKPAPSPSNNPAAPSLEDLHITPAQAKGDAKAQAKSRASIGC
ncbi:MAG: carboxypeptidase regulatory-like domain-containing protein [Terriglobia bacterium]|jgi:hypothetical protein